MIKPHRIIVVSENDIKINKNVDKELKLKDGYKIIWKEFFGLQCRFNDEFMINNRCIRYNDSSISFLENCCPFQKRARRSKIVPARGDGKISLIVIKQYNTGSINLNILLDELKKIRANYYVEEQFLLTSFIDRYELKLKKKILCLKLNLPNELIQMITNNI